MLFGRLAEQNTLTSCEPKFLIEVSRVSTRRSISLREQTASTRTSAIPQQWLRLKESRQLASPLFTQESEVSANPKTFGSLTHPNMGRPMQSNEQPLQQQHSRSTVNYVRRVESFSDVERSLSKGNEIVNWRVCTCLKWKMRKFFLNRKFFMNSLRRRLIELFRENLQFRQDYLRRRLNWT